MEVDELNLLQSAILTIAEKWQPLLGLQDWSVIVKFDETQYKATSTAEPRYKELQLYFNPWRIAKEPEDLEELVVHELSHAFTWRIWELTEKLFGGDMNKWILDELHEEATTSIGRALVNAYREGQSVPNQTSDI